LIDRHVNDPDSNIIYKVLNSM